MQKEPDRLQRKALGRGLSALLPTRHLASPLPTESPVTSVEPQPPSESNLPEGFGTLQSIPLIQIQANREQPRASFDLERLNELAHSIQVNGLLQPITVRAIEGGFYRLIAGERRWRAAAIAGLTEIAAIVRTAEQQEVLELALIENIQREDLNAIEIAMAFQRLVEHHGLSHEQIADRTGKDRSTVTNFLRLLRLSRFVQAALASNKISAGHARTLLNVSNQQEQALLCQRIINSQLSVRETERLVREISAADPEKAKAAPAPAASPQFVLDANTKAALDEIAASLGTKVNLVARTATTGQLVIEYYSEEDIQRIYSVITRQ